MDATHHTLLTRVKNHGDSGAWHEFSGLYSSLLARYANVRGLTPNQNKEVTTDCMAALAAHVQSPDYDPNPAAFKNWMAAILQRRVRGVLRGCDEIPSAATDPEEQPDAEPTPDEEFEQLWNDEHLRHCLEQLRIEVEFKTFEAFRHVAFEEWPVDRVCRTYNLTPQYVYVMKARLTQRLRRLMQSLLGG